MRLHFHAPTVRQLLEHSLAAPTRAATFNQLFDARYRKSPHEVSVAGLAPDAWPIEAAIDQSKLAPGLWLVGDAAGVYLMSNGKPGLMIALPGSGNVIAQAKEADPSRNPDTWLEIKRFAFGADDDVIFLDAGFIQNLLQLASDGVVCIDSSPDEAEAVRPLMRQLLSD